MLNYILRRSIAMPFILLGIVTMAFLLTAITKGDPLTAVVSEQQMNNPEIVAAARQRWGLDRPLPERYLIYVGNLLKGDMGTSFVTRRPVSADLVARLPATFELVIAAMIIGSVIGIVFGLLAAYYRDTAVDQGARIFSLFGSSVPIFWLGLALLFLLSVKYQILPGPGRIDPRLSPPPVVTGFMTIDTLLAGDFAAFKDALAHLVLPSVVLGWTVAGTISRLVRANMLEVMEREFILTARAKGAGEMRVVLRHAFRNILVPVLTVISYSFAYLITGAVLTEAVFAWPGMGSYAVTAARSLDFPAIIGVTIVGGVMFLITNLLTDIAYVLANPRVRLN
ncbi:ABC transporter permease [Mesorhizobium sp. B3-1-9]|uniref:ABC transporter permease n=1 Tax=unclassified Mesorhizobium TaxID=325217 RepID=UPI001128FEF2|nr:MULTISPECIES: ABC transporter permease [unclassified Mesorhizobium]TPI21076.1 ABC transporter permease [Mesorhizobium sp. B4-1-1]TPI38078.1 ABC transporter permease [Mesorhizobium sp. B3-1-9]TPI59311.1 ABC transporter permease [Mesorhizobium sp. B3-1-7]TPL54299.1 ABC transporter permease [Mesorhizobium sp. B2-4-6]